MSPITVCLSTGQAILRKLRYTKLWSGVDFQRQENSDDALSGGEGIRMEESGDARANNGKQDLLLRGPTASQNGWTPECMVWGKWMTLQLNPPAFCSSTKRQARTDEPTEILIMYPLIRAVEECAGEYKISVSRRERAELEKEKEPPKRNRCEERKFFSRAKWREIEFQSKKWRVLRNL